MPLKLTIRSCIIIQKKEESDPEPYRKTKDENVSKMFLKK